MSRLSARHLDQTAPRQRWVAAAAAFSLAAGIIGLFVAPGRSSLWYDELFSLWVISGADAATLWQRIISDVHPPLYYVALWSWVEIVGLSPASLRLLSGCSTAAALLWFVARLPVRLAPRLLAAALAVHSLFLVSQGQNARSYALGALVICALAVQAVRLLRPTVPARGELWALLLFACLCAAVHPYGLLVALATLGSLFLLRPRLWLWLLPPAALIAAGYAAWQYLVIAPNTHFVLDRNWIPSSLNWALAQMVQAAKEMLAPYMALVAILCVPVVLPARRPLARELKERLLLCLMVPVLVWAGAIALSVLLAPSITHRNLMLVAPFLWAGLALLLEPVDAQGGRLSRMVMAGAALCTLGAMAVLQVRLRDVNEPYLGVARAIAAMPTCRNVELLAINLNDPSWARRGPHEPLQAFINSYQLGAGNRAVNLYAADVIAGRADAEVAAGVRRALSGCPVLGMTTHFLAPWPPAAAALDLVARQQGASVVPKVVASTTRIGLADYVPGRMALGLGLGTGQPGIIYEVRPLRR